MEPAPGLAQLLGHRVDEGRGVVVERRLELGHALRAGRVRLGDLRGGPGRNDSELGPGCGGCELDLEPHRELPVVRPDLGHGRSRVAGDHGLQSRARVRRAQAPSMRSASAAAFRALSTPTAATGTPGGI